MFLPWKRQRVVCLNDVKGAKILILEDCLIQINLSWKSRWARHLRLPQLRLNRYSTRLSRQCLRPRKLRHSRASTPCRSQHTRRDRARRAGSCSPNTCSCQYILPRNRQSICHQVNKSSPKSLTTSTEYMSDSLTGIIAALSSSEVI